MTLKETLKLYYEGEIFPSLYNAPTPFEGLPDADTFFSSCKEIESDWRGLVDGGYYATPEGLDVWWMLAFGCVYAAFPEIDCYYRWAGNDEQKPIDKAHEIENYYWEQEDIKHRLSNRFGRE